MELKNELFDEENKVRPPSHPIWRTIAVAGGIGPKYAYTIVLQNRFAVWDLIGYRPTSAPSDKAEAADSESSDKSEEMVLRESDGYRFPMNISFAEWEEMYGEMKFYRRKDRPSYRERRAIKLEHLHEQFFNITKLPCNLRLTCSSGDYEGNFVRIKGTCGHCESKFSAIIANEPVDGCAVRIECSYEGDFKNCTNTSKRRITGVKRKFLEYEMIHEKKRAFHIRTNLAATRMDYGDPEPAGLPTTTALRKMKQRAMSKESAIKDPILALITMKSEEPYSSYVKEISYDPFFVMYWTAGQINAYRHYAKNNRIPILSIDATGTVVKKMNLMSKRRTKDIYLYQITVRDEAKRTQFAVGQMLSESHNNITISFWLKQWQACKVTSPKIVVTDMSEALMIPCANVFTQYSTRREYLNRCWEFITNKNANRSMLPRCMLRNDFAHTMHLVAQCREMAGLYPRIKKFNMHAFAFLVAEENWTELIRQLSLYFVVLLSKTMEESSACETVANYIKKRIAGLSQSRIHTIDTLIAESENEENVDDPDGDCDAENEPVEVTALAQLRNVYQQAKAVAEKNDKGRCGPENPYYKPSLAKKIFDLCTTLPCWGAIMVPYFGYGSMTQTSAPSESTFKVMKADYFKNLELPLRCDVFVQHHITQLTGASNLVAAKYRQHEKEEKNAENLGNIESADDSIESADEDVELAEENWMGKSGTSKVAESKPGKNYLRRNPAILLYSANKSKCPVVGLMRNGSNDKLSYIRVAGDSVILTNTCAIDTLIQILFVICVDSEECEKWLRNEATKGNKFCQLIHDGVRHGITSHLYRKRAETLLDLPEIQKRLMASKNAEKSKIGGVHEISCDSTMTYLVNTLFERYPTVTYQHCQTCNKACQLARTSIHLDLDEAEDVRNLESLVNMYLEPPSKCRYCEAAVQGWPDLAPIMFIDLWVKRNLTQDPEPTKLNLIPDKIEIDFNKKVYKKRGVVSFIPGATLGHFVAYCYEWPILRWVRYNDLENTSKYVKTTTAASEVQYVVYSLP